MATAQDRLLRRMFVVMVLFSFTFVIVGTFHPGLYEGIGTEILHWFAQNVLMTEWASYVILFIILGTMALFIVGGVVLLTSKARVWFHRLNGPDYRKYDDPSYRE